ncbi:MAG: phospho-sugar mutase, partial [Gemmatales bacterium]|nr:phospho-sugar mutase [Gemmatales bacterium]MDW8224193.1 phospho-sugar mutase [Gemmatales bacterium]
MDWLATVREGFAQLDVPEEYRTRAIDYLGHWLTDAEFAEYRPQLEWLIKQQRWAGLLDRFYRILPFGTGGRRGPVGIGPNRMNPWTVAAAVQGHCDYLRLRFSEELARGQRLRVVLAYDVRRFEDQKKEYNPALPNPVLHLSSRDFAHLAAEVYAANGIECVLWLGEGERYLATPELSFAIRYYGAQGGLNISASHNPPDDNGAKFYVHHGGQPVPPEDQLMSDCVERVGKIQRLPFAEAQRHGWLVPYEEEAHRRYIQVNLQQSLLGPAKVNELTVIFTPLHGVGGYTVREVLEHQRIHVVPVAEQVEPNGLFPHVQSANPEVPAAFTEALRLAERVPEADLILASDPDADRLGAMAKQRDGHWRFLTGNEIAALVTHFKLSQLKQRGPWPNSPLVVKTEVTTNLITRIAQRFGCAVVDDLLVGFKYVADLLWQLESRGQYREYRGKPEDFLVASEESHGILVTPQIRDKDAAGAALILAESALYQKRRGLTVVEYLEQLYREYGYFRNVLVNVQVPGSLADYQKMQLLGRALDALRSQPPSQLAGWRVVHFDDYLRPESRFGPIQGETDRLSRNVLVFHAQPDEASQPAVHEISPRSVARLVRALCVDNGEGLRARLIFRPSG